VNITSKQIDAINLSSLNKIPEPILWIDKDGFVVYANKQACEHLGYEHKELLKLGIWDFDPTISQETYRKLWNDHMGTYHIIETEHVKKDKSIVPVFVIGTHECYDGIEVRVSFIRDISSLKANKTLSIREETLLQYEKIMSISHDCLAYIDKESRYRAVNQSYLHVFDLKNTQIIGKKLKEVLPSKHYENIVKERMKRAQNGEDVTFEAWYDFPKLGKRYVQVHYQPYRLPSTGKLDGVVLSLSDITEEFKAKEKLRYMAEYDDLTNLPNRRKFAQELTSLLEEIRNTQEKIAILFIDLDRFKLINDSLGHPAGNIVLQNIAKRLKSNIRQGDILSRAGGDEFLLLARNINQTNEVINLCRQLLALFEKPIIVESNELFISACIGVSIYPGDAADTEGLIQSADTAMAQAKKSGRSIYQFSTDQMREAMFERFFLENSLRLALENKEFLLYFQPQINMNDKTLCGAEVLLRWNHPAMGLISPAKFIPIAEESGLIINIGEWVLYQACQTMKKWQNEKCAPPVLSINVSGQQLLQENFIKQVEDILKTCKLEPSCIELEITESYLMHDTTSVTHTLKALRNLGVSVAIDDFGTSYASLKYLQTLPISRLKIDQSFVRDVPNSKGDCAIVKTIIDLAQNMEMDVIAEGVETKEQSDFLQKNDCFKAQGFLYAKPITQNDFENSHLKTMQQ
jgi:diguanylate cyclase (GGDEF)-like protein/PAS domain S-box-containing protein